MPSTEVILPGGPVVLCMFLLRSYCLFSRMSNERTNRQIYRNAGVVGERRSGAGRDVVADGLGRGGRRRRRRGRVDVHRAAAGRRVAAGGLQGARDGAGDAGGGGSRRRNERQDARLSHHCHTQQPYKGEGSPYSTAERRGLELIPGSWQSACR